MYVFALVLCSPVYTRNFAYIKIARKVNREPLCNRQNGSIFMLTNSSWCYSPLPFNMRNNKSHHQQKCMVLLFITGTVSPNTFNNYTENKWNTINPSTLYKLSENHYMLKVQVTRKLLRYFCPIKDMFTVFTVFKSSLTNVFTCVRVDISIFQQTFVL